MKTLLKFFFFSLAIFSLSAKAQENNSELYKRLNSVPDILSIDKLKTDCFSEKYCLFVEQEVDWKNKTSGKFGQRIILCFKGYDRPTLLVTEGYFAQYGLNPTYEEELSRMFDTNIILCEYRYFGLSAPQVPDWQYLTVDNSLSDLHHVRELFRPFFKGKWISTGISKGGQTTMFYRATYPDDVDVSVSYVAPLNKKVEDGRHEPFLEKEVGTAQERDVIKKAQIEILSRKEKLLPMFTANAKRHNFSYQASDSEIFDYCVFELPFAFWQWGTSIEAIPSHNSSDEEWFSFFIKISESDYFSYPSAFTPFFIQAARELGYYGYSTKGLKKYLKAKKTKNYLHRLMLPENAKQIRFDNSLYKRTVKYLKQSDPKHIFIYGETDPWSASGVAKWLDCSKKKNMHVYVQPKGSHKARISNMPNEMRNEITNRLTEWLQ